jgi:ATP-dependent protease ClpP protease subunit
MKYDIYIDSEISRYWGINAAYVKDALKDIKDEQPINVYISSLGGDVNEALKIRQIFIDRKGKVTAYIYGFTASAATIIATGADEIVQSNAALQLVHQASQWVDTFGQMNKEQIAEAIRKLQEQAEDLATVDGVIASLYVTRYGLTEAEAKELMTAERWLDAKTCKEKGLCDRIIEAKDDKPAKEAQAHTRDRFAAMGLPPAPEQTENSFTNLTENNTMDKKETKLEAFFNALKALFMGEEDPETEPEKKKDEDPAPAPEPEKEEDPEKEDPEKKEDAPEEKCDPEKKEATENELAAEIENLKAQIAALKKADGADTITIEGGAEDEYNAAKAYEQLKGIL